MNEGSLQGLVELGSAGSESARHPALFKHDLAFRPHDFVGQNQIGHPVGLIVHARSLSAPRQRAGNRRCSRIAVKAFSCPPTSADEEIWRKLALGMSLGALEHQVFEKMRDAGFA